MGWAPDPVDVVHVLAIFVLLHSIPSIRSLIAGRRTWYAGKISDDTLYEDEDGTATPETTKEFSNKTQYTVIVIVSVIGFAISIADLVFLTASSPSQNWHDNNIRGIVLLAPAWVEFDSHSLSESNADVIYGFYCSCNLSAYLD